MRTIFTLLSLLFCFTVNAQKLTVDSFKENTRDLSARKSPRFDNNDLPCALVKVQLASKGAVFEGPVMGNVEYKTSEYWVYMPKGSKRLVVKIENYLPLPVEFEPLESNVTYVLTISGIVVNGQQKEVRTKTGWIILDSEPQGADVYINNEFVGNTPLDSYKQPYGTYDYRIEKLNYHSSSGTLELNSGQFEKTIQLKPAFGSIVVTSKINGVNVLLDGKSTGKKTPCTLTEVPSGAHVVSLQKEKYAPMQYNVTVEDDTENVVEGNLDARFASITINSLQGAEIFIDSVSKDTSTCTLDLMEGYYDAEVRLAHHRSATKQIHVVAGQAQTISLNPTPIYGSLDITSTPRGASITIDGKSYGKTPFSVEELLEGSHDVSLSLDGYATEKKQTKISEGQTASISATLQKGREITITTKEVGVKIFIDGKEIGISPYTGILSLGNHTIYGQLRDKKTPEQSIVASQGEGALPNMVLSFQDDHEYVDLGLSVKWATCNVGASSPEDYGDYYAWGETETKSSYNWSVYKWCNGSSTTMTKYCINSRHGTVDNKTILDPEDDVAHVKWGGNWRMPTYIEMDELKKKCTWTWTTQNGKNGYKVTSKSNGKYIFLPAAGCRWSDDLYDAGSYGYYWPGTRSGYDDVTAYYLSFGSGSLDWGNSDRYFGRSVRPVCP